MNYYVTEVIFAFLYVHVDCFVLLSGYLGYQKKFSFQKLLKFWAQVFFWSVVLYFIVNMIQGNEFQPRELIKSLMPITQQRYWFMTTYLLMYVLTPLLNAAIDRLDRSQYGKVLILYFLFFIVLQNVIVWREFTAVNHLSPLFFCFLYMVGAYYRKYPLTGKKSWLILYLGSCTLMTLYKIGVTAITLPIFGEPYGETMMSGYSSILCVTGAVGLFMTFVTMRHRFGNRTAKIVAFASPLTLGVYLIHDNASLRAPLWDAINLSRFADNWYLALILVFVSVAIFVVCLLIEWVRVKLFKYCKVDSGVTKIGGMLDQLLDRICLR